MGWTLRGLKPDGGEIFRTCPDRPWGPPSLLYNGYSFFPRGKERPGCDADPSPPSSAVGHERVELYLYSPCGSYGLYRASVPVQGCTFIAIPSLPGSHTEGPRPSGDILRPAQPFRSSRLYLCQAGIRTRAVYSVGIAATTHEFLPLYYCSYDLDPWVS